ncbi:MAG: hypothetical protein ACHQ4H_04005 [Ktedonobacterales bacterium]
MLDEVEARVKCATNGMRVVERLGSGEPALQVAVHTCLEGMQRARRIAGGTVEYEERVAQLIERLDGKPEPVAHERRAGLDCLPQRVPKHLIERSGA